MRDILESHPLKNLREAVKNSNIKGYSKMKKAELIKEMMKPQHIINFKNIKKYEKPERAKPIKKSEVKKVEKKKAKPIKKSAVKSVSSSKKNKEEPFFKKQLRINREEMKNRKKVKTVVNKVSKNYNIDNFLSKKPSVSDLVKFLSERYDKIDRTDPNEVPLIITALDQLDKELVVDYLNKKGVLKNYFKSRASEKELLEVQLRNKYVKPAQKKIKKVVKKVVKKEEPKKVVKKEAPKKVVKKEEPKKEEPKKKVSNLSTEAKIFYENLNDYLKGSGRQINNLKKLSPSIKEEQIKKIFEGQQYKDFFPTPVECLKKFDFRNINNLLEGTAGLGSVVHFLSNEYPQINLSANELDEEFSKIIKVYNPSVKVMNKDFLKLKNENKYDGIFLNPPFSKFGRGGKKYGMKGGKRPFYFEFLYKALTLLKDLGQGYEKTIYFISPAIVKGLLSDENTFYVEEFLRNANMGKDYMKEIHKKYFGKELKDKDLKELNKTDIGSIPAFEDTPLENISQIRKVGTCAGFGGTNAKAELYEISVF